MTIVYIILCACLMIPLEEIPVSVIAGTKVWKKSQASWHLRTICHLERRCWCVLPSMGCYATAVPAQGLQKAFASLKGKSGNSGLLSFAFLWSPSKSYSPVYAFWLFLFLLLRLVLIIFFPIFLWFVRVPLSYIRDNPCMVLYVGNCLSLL